MTDNHADKKKRGLGRGLDALFQDARKEEEVFSRKIKRADEIVASALEQQSTASPLQAPKSPRKIAIEKLQPGKFQPRRKFNDEALQSLASSIATHGVLQPLLVRAVAGGMYEIIAGERRWRASQIAQVHELPVVVVDLSDKETLEVALIENLQREDLSILEEAEGYQRLMDEFGHTQEELAESLGKSRSHVANTLRLLKLSPVVKKYIEDGALSAGHARALVGCDNAAAIAIAVVKKGLSVRQTEKLVKETAEGKRKIKTTRAINRVSKKDIDTMALEEKMTSLLGMKLTIESTDGKSGRLVVEYKDLEQLDDLLEKLSSSRKKQHQGVA